MRGVVMMGALGIVPIEQAMARTISRNVRASVRGQFEGKLRFVLHDPSRVADAIIEEK